MAKEGGGIKVEIALHVALYVVDHISGKAFKSDCNPRDLAGLGINKDLSICYDEVNRVFSWLFIWSSVFGNLWFIILTLLNWMWRNPAGEVVPQ